MITGTAGRNVHGPDALEQLRGVRPERRFQQIRSRYALFQGLRNGARLLVNLLEHEMPVLAALDGVCGQFALAHRPHGRYAIRVHDADGFAADLRDVALLQEHEPAGHRQQRRHVGSDEVFIDAEPDDHRASRTREHDALRIRFAHDRQRVRPVQFADRPAHGLTEAACTRQMMVDSMRDHFGVGFRAEGIPEVDEPGPQRLVVFDDAVVHDGDAVERDVRMRIARGRHAVGGPAGVGDADVPRDGRRGERVLQCLDLAHRAQTGELMTLGQHGEPRRIVAAVLEAPQALDEDRNRIAFRNNTDDSAHALSPLRRARSKRASVPRARWIRRGPGTRRRYPHIDWRVPAPATPPPADRRAPH